MAMMFNIVSVVLLLAATCAADPGRPTVVWTHAFPKAVYVPPVGVPCQNFLAINNDPDANGGMMAYLDKEAGGPALPDLSGQSDMWLDRSVRHHMIVYRFPQHAGGHTDHNVYECRCGSLSGRLQLPNGTSWMSWVGAGRPPVEFPDHSHALWYESESEANKQQLFVRVNGTVATQGTFNYAGPQFGYAVAGDLINFQGWSSELVYQVSTGKQLWKRTRFNHVCPMTTNFKYAVYHVDDFRHFIVLPYPGTQHEVDTSRVIQLNGAGHAFPRVMGFSAPDNIFVIAWYDAAVRHATELHLFAFDATDPTTWLWNRTVVYKAGFSLESVMYSACTEVSSAAGISVLTKTPHSNYTWSKYQYNTGKELYTVEGEADSVRMEEYCRPAGGHVTDNIYGTIPSQPNTVFRAAVEVAPYAPSSPPPRCPTPSPTALYNE